MIAIERGKPLHKFDEAAPAVYVLRDAEWEYAYEICDAGYLVAYVYDPHTFRAFLENVGPKKLRRVRFLPDTPPNHWLREAYGSYLEFWGWATPAELQYDGSWYKEPTG